MDVTPVDAIALKNEVRKSADFFADLASKYNSLSKKCLALEQIIDEFIAAGTEDNAFFKKAVKRFLNYCCETLFMADKIYAAFNLPEQLLRFVGRHEMESMYLENIAIPHENCDAFYNDEKLFFRTKILPRVNFRRDQRLAEFLSKYNTHLCRSLEILEAKMLEEGTLYRDKFVKKVVRFLYVYSPDDLKKKRILDSDNHDTKNALDSVTAYLPCGDEALHCSVMYETIVTDIIEKGTYITIENTDLPTITVDKVIDIWKGYLKSGE